MLVYLVMATGVPEMLQRDQSSFLVLPRMADKEEPY